MRRGPSLPPSPLGLTGAGLRITRLGIFAWSAVALLLLAWAGWEVLSRLRIAVIVLAVVVLIVALLEPLVGRLARRGVPRWAGAGIAIVVLLGPLGAGAALLVRGAFAQLDGLLKQGPELFERFEGVWDAAGDAGIPLPAETLGDWFAENREAILEAVTAFLTAVPRLAVLVGALLLAPVIAFLVLADLPRLREIGVGLLPSRMREGTLEAGRIVGRVTMGFLRGQLIIAFLVGLMSVVGLILMGVPYALLIGAIAGFSNLIPFFGPIVGAVPGMAVGWAEGGIWLAVGVAVLFTVVQQIESQLLSPLILGRTVRVRPFAIILGMLAGAAVAGLVGMILAVPVVAAVKDLYLRFGPPAGGRPGPQGEPSAAGEAAPAPAGVPPAGP